MHKMLELSHYGQIMRDIGLIITNILSLIEYSMYYCYKNYSINIQY